jgi:protein XagA
MIFHKIKNIGFVFFAFLMLLPLVSQAGGPWPQRKGFGFFKLDFSFIRATDIFDSKGLLVATPTIGNYTTSVFGEYGLTNKLTAIAYVPLFVRNTLNETVGIQTGQVLQAGLENNALGDVDLGLRYGLVGGKVPISASILVGLPTGDSKNSDGLLTGDGEFNQYLRLETGTSGNKWWLSADAGFNNRTGGFSDEVRYNAEFGYKLLNTKLLAILKIGGIKSLKNGSANDATQGLFSNNVEFFTIAPEISYLHKNKWGVSARLGLAVPALTRNILAAPAVSLGLFYVLGE